MITVTVSINGAPIFTRSAVNQLVEDLEGKTRYNVDDGTEIWHKRDAGAVKLAIAMLKLIKEPKSVR